MKWHKADNIIKRELTDINIVSSGMASCLGRYSMTGLVAHAAAHAATGIDAARLFLHGEHVAAGLIVQETLLKGKKNLSELKSFFEIMELPQGLAGISIKKQDLKVFFDKYQAIDKAEKISGMDVHVFMFVSMEIGRCKGDCKHPVKYPCRNCPDISSHNYGCLNT